MTEVEVLHVLEREHDIEIAEEAFIVGAGDAVLVPAGEQFRVSNSFGLVPLMTACLRRPPQGRGAARTREE